MSRKNAFLGELDQENNNTRRLLEAIPMEHAQWKPHEKSMTLAQLATHIAEIGSWVRTTLEHDELDFADGKYKPTPLADTREALLSLHDCCAKDAIDSLTNAEESTFNEIWTLRNGEEVYFSLPKVAVLRVWVYNHLYHHRGQMTVYLRLLGVKIPGMYGPTADDIQ